VYIKSFFIIILFYVLIILSAVLPINERTELLLIHTPKQSFIVCGWDVVYKIIIGELVVREDGKFLKYKHTKTTYKRRWYR
jgi:hypothetical protein